jgi:argininosuccinate lyase
MLPNIKVKSERMKETTCSGFINATDLADYLASKGMPFREAHSVTGKLVGYAGKKGLELHELSVEEMQPFSGLIEKDIYPFLTTEKMVDRRVSEGGTATVNVEIQIKNARKSLCA